VQGVGTEAGALGARGFVPGAADALVGRVDEMGLSSVCVAAVPSAVRMVASVMGMPTMVRTSPLFSS
jgi:hypothetical protein